MIKRRGRQIDGLIVHGVKLGHPIQRNTGIVYLLLHRNRAGRRRMDGDPVRRQIVFGAQLGRHLEETHEHTGHPLTVGDRVFFDSAERLFGIEFFPSPRQCRPGA